MVAIIERGDPAGIQPPGDPPACRTAKQPTGDVRLTDFVASDSHATEPTVLGADVCERENGRRDGELDRHALTLDVPFTAFLTNPLIAAAAAYLNSFSVPLEGAGSSVSASTLFRGPFAGSLTGPFVSQFLWLDVPYGPTSIVQRYRVPAPGQSFLTERDIKHRFAWLRRA